MERTKYKIISIRELQQFVEKTFRNYDEIQLGYLYGSYAMGNQNEFSDIDIGIVLEKDFEEPPLYFAKFLFKFLNLTTISIDITTQYRILLIEIINLIWFLLHQSLNNL